MMISSCGGSDHWEYAVADTNSRIRVDILKNLLIDKFMVLFQLMRLLYFVDYKSQADLKIFFVDYKSQAGWNKKEQKHLLY